MTGTEQLRAQLATLRDSLRAFEDPIVEEVPGLRLMQETLREREAHIAEQIRKNETCSLRVVLRGAAVADAVPLGVVTVALESLRAAVATAALQHVRAWEVTPPEQEVLAAVEPHLADICIEGGDVGVTLLRPPGEVAAQLTDPRTGAPLAEVAFTALLHTAGRAGAGERPDAAARGILGALHPLAALLTSLPLTLRLSLDPHVLDPLEAVIDRPTAQRLVTADTAT